jgi:hypothetical protein
LQASCHSAASINAWEVGSRKRGRSPPPTMLRRSPPLLQRGLKRCAGERLPQCRDYATGISELLVETVTARAREQEKMQDSAVGTVESSLPVISSERGILRRKEIFPALVFLRLPPQRHRRPQNLQPAPPHPAAGAPCARRRLVGRLLPDSRVERLVVGLGEWLAPPLGGRHPPRYRRLGLVVQIAGSAPPRRSPMPRRP